MLRPPRDKGEEGGGGGEAEGRAAGSLRINTFIRGSHISYLKLGRSAARPRRPL